jgi:hypothetical protein
VKKRYERQARNEAFVRTVNERMSVLDAEAAGWADHDERFDFQCECGEPDGCGALVTMTLAEYERVRLQRDRFAVAPGHQNDAIEDVVQENERYCIVDKRDAYEPFVE